ncbi:MAG: hypothetical protein WBW73_01080 [Rhodoplanes sp.]
MNKHNDSSALLAPLEALRIVRLKEAARLSGVSVETLKRRHRAKIIEISPRALGMRVKDALQLKSVG